MIAAVDLGSTNFKAALFDAEGKRLADASEPLPYRIHTESRAELDPESVERTFFALLDNLVESAGHSLVDIRRLALASQAQTFLITTAEGTPLCPFYGWSDDRAGEEASLLQERLGKSFHRHCGFPEVNPRLMISKVWWWKKRHSWDKTYRVVSLPSYLGMSLGAEHGNDSNLAAMSGFHSLPSGWWWQEALEATGIFPEQLGAIIDAGRPLGMRKEKTPPGFHRKLEIFPAGNDHTAGAVGCGCREGQPILTLGTAGVLYRHAGAAPGPYSQSGLWGPYPPGGYYELKCLNHACSALDWANEYLFGKVDSPEFSAIASKAGIGADTPFFDPLKWGSSEAWRGSGDTIAKAYAAFEGILFALKSLAGDDFCRSDVPFTILGGGSRLDFWVQLAADCFNAPIRHSQGDGLSGSARICSPEEPFLRNSSENTSLIKPNPARSALLEKRYQTWLNNS